METKDLISVRSVSKGGGMNDALDLAAPSATPTVCEQIQERINKYYDLVYELHKDAVRLVLQHHSNLADHRHREVAKLMSHIDHLETKMTKASSLSVDLMAPSVPELAADRIYSEVIMLESGT